MSVDLAPPLPRVLVVEPNAALRSAILTFLAEEHYPVEQCESLQAAVRRADEPEPVIALVAWQSMDGLLTDEHRHHLVELTRRLRLLVMMPRRWARLLEATDLGVAVAGIIPKPFEPDELLFALRRAAPVASTAS